MGQLVHFYSTNVGWRDDLSGPGVTGPNRAATTGALSFEIVNFDAFVDEAEDTEESKHED
jgi:hypothetical protein